MIKLDIAHRKLQESVLSKSVEKKKAIASELRKPLMLYKDEWESSIGNEYGEFSSFDLADDETPQVDGHDDLDDVMADVEKAVAILLNRRVHEETEPANISGNLAGLFGKDADDYMLKYNDVDISDWAAPSSYGLQNAEKLTDVDFYNEDKPTNTRRGSKKVSFALESQSSDSQRLKDLGVSETLLEALFPGSFSAPSAEPSSLAGRTPSQAPAMRDTESDQDEDDEDDSEYENDAPEYEENRLANISMAPSLMKLLGMEVKEPIITDWKPPARPGLDNSAPLVPTKHNVAPAHKDDSTRGVEAAAAAAAEEEEEDDDDDNEEDEGYDDSEGEEDSGDVEGRLYSTAMSPALMAALGLAPSTPIVTDWKPPDRPGLDNSRPIVSMASMDSAATSAETVMSPWAQQMHDSNNFYRAPSLRRSQEAGSNTVGLSISAEDEEEDEDEEDDYEEEEEEEDMSKFKDIPMSAALRQALGLPEVVVETDWRPPAAPGLNNSAPLVKFQ
eukprot:gene28134-33973_t